MTLRQRVKDAAASVGALIGRGGDQTEDKERREADRAKDEHDEYIERRRLEATTELEVHKQVLTAMIDVAKGSIDRSRDSAKFVQASAAALATVYTTLLAIVFSVTDNPLPPRGFIPTIFLGLATALATAYLAFITHPKDVHLPPPSSDFRENARRKVDGLIEWTASGVQERARFLRAAVWALFFGVLFLPVAVLSSSSLGATNAATVSSSPGTSASGPAGASPTPTWPPAPNGSPDAYSVELYKAQLAAHVASGAASTAPTTHAKQGPDWVAEALAWLVAAGGFLFIVREALRKPTEPRSAKEPGMGSAG